MQAALDTSFIARRSRRKSLESRPGKITGEQYVRWGRIQDLMKVEIDEKGVPRDRRRLRTNESLRNLWQTVVIWDVQDKLEEIVTPRYWTVLTRCRG